MAAIQGWRIGKKEKPVKYRFIAILIAAAMAVGTSAVAYLFDMIWLFGW